MGAIGDNKDWELRQWLSNEQTIMVLNRLSLPHVGAANAMSNVTFIGLAAATCTTLAFFPQVVKAWRSRSTADISLGMFIVLVIGIALWLIYGILVGDVPLIAANAVTLVLVGIILFFKLRYG